MSIMLSVVAGYARVAHRAMLRRAAQTGSVVQYRTPPPDPRSGRSTVDRSNDPQEYFKPKMVSSRVTPELSRGTQNCRRTGE